MSQTPRDKQRPSRLAAIAALATIAVVRAGSADALDASSDPRAGRNAAADTANIPARASAPWRLPAGPTSDVGFEDQGFDETILEHDVEADVADYANSTAGGEADSASCREVETNSDAGA